MTLQIRKAAVIGAGVMGAAIAAHLANVGISVLLLDIAPNQLTEEEQAKGLSLESPVVRNRFAAKGLEAAKRAKPASFYDAKDACLIQIGNLTDHLELLSDCDWIIEAVVENLNVKRQVLSSIESVANPQAVVSSNTSGISIAEMSTQCSFEFRQRFLGTHFFNPPRYMKLLEIIPGPDTNEEIIQSMSRFGERVLGKGVVRAKDTPNFIANRIGTYGLVVTLEAMKTYGLGVDEVDVLTGPILGRPKSATFRTLDIVGLDTFVHVCRNVQATVPDLDEKTAFEVPAYLQQMVDNGWLGEKTGQGFYKREKTANGNEIYALDLETMTYRPRKKLQSTAYEAAKNAKSLSDKIQALAYAKDSAGRFTWDILKKVLLYTAVRQSTIADDIVSVDNAMKWGFNWELGPYEIWDAIGVEKSVQRMRDEGETIPEFVEALLKSGKTSFYEYPKGQTPNFYTHSSEFVEMDVAPEQISLARLKDQGKVIRQNSGATLVDIGDGIACLELHPLKQAIGLDVIQMIQVSIEEVSKNWNGLVLASSAKDFCVGANLMMMLMEAQDENWDELNHVIFQLQHTLLKLKYMPKPMVSAPHALTLGGGAELCFPADAIQASAESYIGLVEVGVGLIPGGGGNKEMLIRAIEGVPDKVEERLDQFVRQAFETVAMAKVSTSAKDAKTLGYLRSTDGISANRDFLIHDAKQVALGMVNSGYTPPQQKSVRVVGEAGAAMLQMGIYGMQQSGFVSSHDVVIANHLIRVMTGGAVARDTLVTEEYLLQLEREAFLSLLGEPKTQARMQHMLTKGKPLRN